MIENFSNALTQVTDNGTKSVRVHDALTQLLEEVVYLLQVLADLLIQSNPEVAMRELPQPTLENLGWLLDSLVVKAETILREYGLSENESED